MKQFLLNVLLTLATYFTLCAAVIAVTHSGYCRCGACDDCKLRLGSGDEETTMTQATASTTIWPRVALFNYFAVPMLFDDTATARRLPLDWTSSLRSGEFYSATTPEEV